MLEQNLLHAVEYISIERGYSPRRFTLVAAGGAGPMHGTNVARGLGCRRVYVPRDAGALCAIGMLHADVRQDFRTLSSKARSTNSSRARSTAGWPNWAIRPMPRCRREGFGPDQVVLEREIDLHYRGQLWSIRVPLAEQTVRAQPRCGALSRPSTSASTATFSPDGTIMAASLRVAARAATGTPKARRMEASARNGTGKPDGTRTVWHGKHGWLDTAIYDGAGLGARGTAFPGPPSSRSEPPPCCWARVTS